MLKKKPFQLQQKNKLQGLVKVKKEITKTISYKLQFYDQLIIKYC